MAKYAGNAAGSSSHVHQSLRTLDGQPAFFDPGAPHGMSKLMQSWLAGLLEHAGAVTFFLAPYVNSYKRFAAGTFAPTKAIWSTDNRTAGYRLVGEGSASVRVECRVGGADLNPYLAFAAQIAAGIDGIERGLALEPEFRGDAYRRPGARDPEDAARRHRGASPLEDAARGASARTWSSTTSTPPAGSRRNSTARSPTGKWRAASSGAE